MPNMVDGEVNYKIKSFVTIILREIKGWKGFLPIKKVSTSFSK